MEENRDVQAHQVMDDLRSNYDPKKKVVTICAGTGCRADGSLKVKRGAGGRNNKNRI